MLDGSISCSLEIIVVANKVKHITRCYAVLVINGSRFHTKGLEMNKKC